eukprot:scaffold41707_cov35-Prasinocladus_malaysianus.AAC.1
MPQVDVLRRTIWALPRLKSGGKGFRTNGNTRANCSCATRSLARSSVTAVTITSLPRWRVYA